MYSEEGEEVSSYRERRNRNSRSRVNHINGVNMEEFRRKMRALTEGWRATNSTSQRG